MFAILQHGGKQYKVSVGDIIELAKMEVAEGEVLTFKEVLLTADGANIEVGQPFVSVSIEAKVVSHGRSDKVRVYKKKSKKRYTRTQGHRQDYTEVEIISIGGSTAKKAPAKKAEKAEVTEGEKEVKAKKAPAKKVEKTEEKKPATKKKAE